MAARCKRVRTIAVDAVDLRFELMQDGADHAIEPPAMVLPLTS